MSEMCLSRRIFSGAETSQRRTQKVCMGGEGGGGGGAVPGIKVVSIYLSIYL